MQKSPNQNGRKSISRFTIFVRMYNGNGCNLTVQLTDTVSHLLEALKQGSFDLPANFRLVFMGRQISNYLLTLQKIGVRQQSIIHIEPLLQDEAKQIKMQIGVYVNGEKIVLRVKKTETIKQIKNKIRQLLQAIPKKLYLIYRGQQLKNQKNLQDYHIQDGSLMCLMSKQSLAFANAQQLNSYKGLQPNQYLQNSTISLGNEYHAPQLQMFRSQKMFCKDTEEECGYQIGIHRKNSNASDLLMSKEFIFDLFEDEKAIHDEPLNTKDQLRSTKSKDSSLQCHQYNFISKNKVSSHSDVSFSERLMII